MGSYRLTRRADRDLIDIYLYTFESFGVQQAERYADSMRRCFTTLAEHPGMGQRADAIRPGLRRHEHGGHVIFYRHEIMTDDVLILAVLHARMQHPLAESDLS